MARPRQAVVIIHGIGEQRPMETLRSFVLGVLGSDKKADGRRAFYSKPDPNAETFELRRYRAFTKDQDTDFIEFYWQHQMPVAPWRFLFSWLWLLMKRPAKSMPPRFVILWWIAWIAAGVLLASLLSPLLARLGAPIPDIAIPVKVTGAGAIVAGAVGFIVRAFVGDAATYLNPHPRTVEARNAIRASGVALLERLHKDGRYDRIIVAGHSLGSVIGYDILSFAWHRASEEFRRKVETGDLPSPMPPQTELAAAEQIAARDGPVRGAEWTAATRAAAAETKALGLSWLITDFITLGSPLAHASLLLARGPEDFRRRVEERELPVSPPYMEDGAHFSYMRPDSPQPKARIPDHAALFAMTEWTNLYFPCRFLIYGDAIGGPLQPWFGAGVVDQAVLTRIWKGWFAHTQYWTRYPGSEDSVASAPRRLVEALDLTRSGFRIPNGGSAGRPTTRAKAKGRTP